MITIIINCVLTMCQQFKFHYLFNLFIPFSFFSSEEIKAQVACLANCRRSKRRKHCQSKPKALALSPTSHYNHVTEKSSCHNQFLSLLQICFPKLLKKTFSSSITFLFRNSCVSQSIQNIKHIRK